MCAETAKDVYTNFSNSPWLTVVHNAITLNSVDLDTGLSIRGRMVWLIHAIEWHYGSGFMNVAAHAADGSDGWDFGLSTRKGLSAVPTPIDDGCIDVRQFFGRQNFATAVAYKSAVNKSPDVTKFLPPVPIAKNNLTLYGICTGGTSFWQTAAYLCIRIRKTTAQLDGAMYTEIAEVWGY